MYRCRWSWHMHSYIGTSWLELTGDKFFISTFVSYGCKASVVPLISNLLDLLWLCVWATICRTVHPMLSDHCLSVLSVCNVGVLWPNGWTDQDETWHAGRPRPWPHCVRWDPAPPPPKGHSPQFSAHVRCGQTAGWIKTALGMEVGLVPGHIMLHGDPGPLPRKGAEPPPIRPVFIVAKCLDGSRWHLVWRQASAQATLC